MAEQQVWWRPNVQDNAECSVFISIMMTSLNGNIFRVTGPLCGNSPMTVELPSQRPATHNFVFFGLRLNRRLSKQSIRRCFETSSRSLWRHCNVIRVSSKCQNNNLTERTSWRLSRISICQVKKCCCLCRLAFQQVIPQKNVYNICASIPKHGMWNVWFC